MPTQPVASPVTPLVPAVRIRALRTGDVALLLAGRRPRAGRSWHPEYPLVDTLTALRLSVEAHRVLGGAPPGVSPWWLYQVLAGDQVVGDVGFHGPPAADGSVEIGYAVVPAWRGRGVARAAVRLLLKQAWTLGIAEVWAETDPGNVASRQVLLRCGFTALGEARFVILRPDNPGRR